MTVTRQSTQHQLQALLPVLPPPDALGLPPRFNRWRPGQAEAALKALDSDKRFVVLGMPTGFGKSLVYMTAGVLSDEPTVFLTSTKGLQNQLVDDFSESGLVDIRGMGNYPCQESQGDIFQRTERFVGCDEGPCLSGWKCGLAESGCNYFDAQRAARSSDLTVSNYAYWMAINGQSHKPDESPLGRRGRIVLDEAHAAIDELGDYLAIEVGHWEVEGVLGRTFPVSEDIGEWRTWARTLGAMCVQKAESLSAEVRLGVSNNRRSLSRLRELKDLGRRLDAIATMTKREEWVMEDARDRRGRRVVRFDPVWPASYAESSLFLNTPKVVLTSATIRPKTLELLGVNTDAYEFLEYPSSFPAELRPFIWVPTVRVRYDMDPSHGRLWVAKIDAILRRRQDRKGVIHTISYQRRDYLLRYSEFARSMVVHDTGGIQDTVRRFREMRPPAVLVSPSVGTGFDFPGDDCRYQIIGKVPFPSTQSKVLKARQERDKDYFAYVAAQNLTQMSGRGMRSADDWCETIIVDDNWQWFSQKYKAMFPKWFIASWRKSVNPPEPLCVA